MSRLLNSGGLWFLSANLLARFSNTVTMLFLAKTLRPELFGQLAQYLSFAMLLVPLISLSSNESYTYFASRHEIGQGARIRLLKEFSTLNIFVGLAILTVVSVLSGLVRGIGWQYSLFALYALIYSLYFLNASFYRAIGRNRAYSTSSIWFSLTVMICVIFFGFMGYRIEWAWVTGGALVGIKLLAMSLARFYSHGARTSILTVPEKQHISYSTYLTFGVFSSVALMQLDTLIIGHIAGDIAAGQYKFLSIIPTTLMIIPSSVLAADFKSLVKDASHPNRIIDYYKRFIRFFAPTGIVISIAVYFGIELYFKYFFHVVPRHFQLIRLSICALIVLFFVARVPFGNIFNALGHAKFNVWLSAATLFLNVSLNIYLVPTLGVAGGFVSALLSYVFSTSCCILFIKSLLNGNSR